MTKLINENKTTNFTLNTQQFHEEMVDIVNYLNEIELRVPTYYHDVVTVIAKPIRNQGTFYLHFDKPVNGLTKIGLTLKEEIEMYNEDLNLIYSFCYNFIRSCVLSLISSKLEYKSQFTLIPNKELRIRYQ